MEREATQLGLAEVVYYIHRDGLIKIGFTRDLRGRMLGLLPMALLAIEPGGRKLETARHRQFKAEKVGEREWFQPSPALHRHIAKCACLHPVPDLDALVDHPSTLTGLCYYGHRIVGPNYQRSKEGGHVCKACFGAQIAVCAAGRKGLPPVDFTAWGNRRYEELMAGEA